MSQEITFNQIELLDPTRHNREAFDCGVEQLNIFLKQKANKESGVLSKTFVLTCTQEPGEILGFYSLSATKLSVENLPDDLKKKYGHYGGIPATLLGRLASATKFQGNKDLRVGETLLIHAMKNSYQASLRVASYGLLVDVLISKEVDPRGFYQKYGFVSCENSDTKMYLPMKTIYATLKSSKLVD